MITTWYNSNYIANRRLKTGRSLESNSPSCKYKVPLWDAPISRGVAQERIENDTACDIVSYAYLV